MATPAPQPLKEPGTVPGETPSLDPLAIQRAYVRERARRRARVDHLIEGRHSDARYWAVMLTLVFLVAFGVLATWWRLQTLFGI